MKNIIKSRTKLFIYLPSILLLNATIAFSYAPPEEQEKKKQEEKQQERKIRRKLFFAIIDDNIDAIPMIIFDNPDILLSMTTTTREKNPLEYAIKIKSNQAAKYFIKNFKKVKWPAHPLHLAAHYDNAEIIDFIFTDPQAFYLKQIDVLNTEKQTPLMIAIKRNSLNAVQELLKHNPDQSIIDIYKKTAWDYADNYTDKTIKNLLETPKGLELD